MNEKFIKQEDMVFLKSFYEKVKSKLNLTSDIIKGRYPYTTENGKYTNLDFIGEWYPGFWCGMMWLMYDETGDRKYFEYARQAVDGLDEGFRNIREYDHDVGFVYGLSAVADYNITGNKESLNRGYLAACALMGRFNLKGGFFRSQDVDTPNRFIVDTMMNLPLLYWASEVTEDDRFTQLAMVHADTVNRVMVRGDGSVDHVVKMDFETGEVSERFGGQGYAGGSSWTRGQAWAIYGFALSYLHTGKKEYLDTAKKVAHYFMACTDESGVAPIDFRAPKDNPYKDTTASACAACGYIEIAKHVGEFEKELYLNAAVKILRGLEKCCDFSDTEESILQMGSEDYHYMKQNLPIIYGDYFMLEALYRICGKNKIMMW